VRLWGAPPPARAAPRRHEICWALACHQRAPDGGTLLAQEKPSRVSSTRASVSHFRWALRGVEGGAWPGRWGRLHLVAAAALCVALPGASWVGGHGWLAWRMYSGSETYRLAITVWNAAGEGRRVAPTELAAHSTGDLAVFLTGTERWRRDPVGPVLARHADDLAALTCRMSGALRVRLTVEYRLNLDDAGRATAVERRCIP
jgi:hypothetical protein